MISRRAILKSTVGLASLGALPQFTLAQTTSFPANSKETHGLSVFGDLALPIDFKHFAYVNPTAPDGGTLVLQLTQENGNQNFSTFDTLNTFVMKGNGAAGMEAIFDTLMTANGDEPASIYGLLAKSVKVSPDRLHYQFLLRSEARFHDGSPITGQDVVFSFNILKEQGHPIYALLLDKVASATSNDALEVTFNFLANRSRDLHLVVAGLPIFSKAYWQDRDFQAPTLESPLGSSAYKVARLEPGHFIEFEQVESYWGKELPVNVGLNNFHKIRYEYYRSRDIAFEAFKNGTINYHEEFTSRIWNKGYDFPAVTEEKVKKEVLPDGKPVSTQGIYFNLRRPKFKDPLIRQAIGLLFDFEWTNKNVMFSSYRRLTSLYQNTPMMASGLPSAGELVLLEPWRGKIPDSAFAQAFVPPVSDGSGADRTLLRQADDLLRKAGCKRDGSRLLLADATPFTIEYLDTSSALQPIIDPFQANLRRLGIDSQTRTVDPSNYKSRLDQFDFDMTTRALGGTFTPGDDLRAVFGSQAAITPGSQNIAGISDPAIDALIDVVANAQTRDDLDVAARAFDRLFRANFYWIPMYYRDTAWIACWDVFSRPDHSPKFSTGAPATWWWDDQKAKKTGWNK